MPVGEILLVPGSASTTVPDSTTVTIEEINDDDTSTSMLNNPDIEPEQEPASTSYYDVGGWTSPTTTWEELQTSPLNPEEVADWAIPITMLEVLYFDEVD